MELARLLGVVVALAAPAAAQSVIFTVPGTSPGDHLGEDVAAAGDVNGDGWPDLIAGAPGDSTNGALAGSAQVLSGTDGTLLYLFLGDNANDDFGSAVAGAGDVDGDGRADLIVGARGADNAAMNAGRARVFSGLDGSILYTLDGNSSGDGFGFSVAGVGDANGDGFGDFAVGANLDDPAGLQSGSVWVYSGLDGSVLHHFKGSAKDEQLGVAVAGAGDVNADGYDDVIVGLGMDDPISLPPGQARVYSGLDGRLLHDLEGDLMGDSFGRAIAGAGDVDADGFADVIVGAPYDNDGGYSSGSAWVFSGFDGSVLHVFSGGPDDLFGTSVGGARDVDGDGHDDLVVGSPIDNAGGGPSSGSLKVFSGLDGSPLLTHPGGDPYDLLGTAVDGVGDVDGDGSADVAVGAHWDDDNGTSSGTVTAISVCDGQGTSYCSPAVANSTGLPAVILACGSSAVAENRLRLSARDMPLSQFGYFLVSQTPGFVQGPGGSQGNLCLGGTIGRFAQQVRNTGVTGRFGIPVDLTSLPSGLGAVQPGDTWRFQAWYRDVNPGETSNFTDAVALTFS